MQKYGDYYKKVLHKLANHIPISQKVVVKHKITTIFSIIVMFFLYFCCDYEKHSES